MLLTLNERYCLFNVTFAKEGLSLNLWDSKFISSGVNLSWFPLQKYHTLSEFIHIIVLVFELFSSLRSAFFLIF